MTANPTARVTLVRTSGRVSLVRAQEPGQLPVWTIHLRGEAPIYVALTRADADRVFAHWVELSGPSWLVKSFHGRGARTAHLCLPGRRAVCGTPMGYGNLVSGNYAGVRKCQRCARTAGAA